MQLFNLGWIMNMSLGLIATGMLFVVGWFIAIWIGNPQLSWLSKIFKFFACIFLAGLLGMLFEIRPVEAAIEFYGGGIVLKFIFFIVAIICASIAFRILEFGSPPWRKRYSMWSIGYITMALVFFISFTLVNINYLLADRGLDATPLLREFIFIFLPGAMFFSIGAYFASFTTCLAVFFVASCEG